MYYSKILIPFILVSGVFACSEIASVNVEEHLNASKESSKQLAVQLKAKLKASLQADGPLEAITVCNVEAENIAKLVSDDNNLQVGRTSLKLRNSSNTADAWEREKLIGFEQLKESGKKIEALEVYEITKEDNQKWFRYMKAIPTQDVCLVCHGEAVAIPVQERLKTLYPNDQATGYKIGEIRGAFTVKIKL